ncbi:MAG TPA: ABC transporter substrate-binding protein, partial [Actinomycetota bacterium]|nr:ABC transporter substrate-binding protein [Actinomycetota bacterium]
LDPMRVKDPASMQVARQLYEGLTRWDPVAEKVVPAVARSWRVSDGGRTFTFRLRRDTRFHNGTPVTAEHFALAFDRIASKRNGSDLAYALDDIRGFAAVNRKGTANHLSGIRTPDPHTLVISLARPFADFPAVLTHPGLVPVLPGRLRRAGFWLEPIGNGPFRMARTWSPGDPVYLRAFEGFFSPPRLDGIAFLPFPSPEASWPYLEAGSLQVAEVPPSRIESARRELGSAGEVPILAGYYYGLNLKAPGLRDIRLRRAVNRAIDRARLAAHVFDGTLRVPRGIVPWGLPGFGDNACGDLCDYDPKAAAALVAKLPRGHRSITLQFTQGSPHETVAHEIARYLRAAGLDVELRPFSLGRYLRMLARGEQRLFRLSWIAEYPTPDVFLTDLFSSSSPDDYFGFDDPKVDRLLARARRATQDYLREALYKRAEFLILRRAPIVPIGSYVSHWVARPEVQNIHFDVMGGFDASSVGLAGG